MLYPLSYRGMEKAIVANFRFDSALAVLVHAFDHAIVIAMDTEAILENTRTIAVVGMSDNPDRASNEVARYLMDYYDIIPVNPNHNEILGLKCYPDLESIPVKIDMVDVFQRSENVPRFVEPAIAIGARVFWMQLGIKNEEAARSLEAAGIEVVQDHCAKIEHMRMLAGR